MFVKVTNGQVDQYPYTVGMLHHDNPTVSFPRRIPNTLLAEWGVYPVTPAPEPDVDHTKNVSETAPELVGNAWTQTWSVTEATAEEVVAREKQAAKNTRALRDKMLNDSDWIVIKAQETNTATSPAWTAYRQALRDITEHANFPWLNDEDWPVKPE